MDRLFTASTNNPRHDGRDTLTAQDKNVKYVSHKYMSNEQGANTLLIGRVIATTKTAITDYTSFVLAWTAAQLLSITQGRKYTRS
jgi:hypothetical protein